MWNIAKWQPNRWVKINLKTTISIAYTVWLKYFHIDSCYCCHCQFWYCLKPVSISWVFSTKFGLHLWGLHVQRCILIKDGAKRRKAHLYHFSKWPNIKDVILNCVQLDNSKYSGKNFGLCPTPPRYLNRRL